MVDPDSTLPSPSTGTQRGAEERHVSLLVYHRAGGEMVALRADKPLVVGRAAPADVVRDDPDLSRQHARFELVGDQVWVEDLGSTNGTWVGGERVTRAIVRAGAEVTIGPVTISIHALEPAGPRPPGVDSHDRFLEALEHEVERARTFRRSLALLMVRASKPDAGLAPSWVGSMRKLLRPVDRVGSYGPRAVLVSLPEMDADAAVERAFVLLAGARVQEPSLVCGIALFPDVAGSAEQLVEVARAECQRVRPGAVPALPATHASGTVPALDAGGPVVRSPAMKRVFETVKKAAGSRIPVLVLGETGTGKEVVARALHEGGPRSKGPLRFVNCGAIPATLVESVLFGHERGAFTGAVREQKGAFEEASGGTLLLDEIGELPMAAQTTLLRVLETRRLTRIGSTREIEVDVRVVTATNRDLEGMVAAGTFRQDLLYRLNTLVIALPPLRQRREEIAPLAERFLEEANRTNGSRVRGVDASALELLCEYDWPGNVRELRNVIERAVVLAQGDTITTEDLSDRIVAPLEEGPEPAPTSSDDTFKSRVRRYETQLIVDALKETNGNQTEAARRLGMPLRTLVHKLGTLGLRKRGHSHGS